MSYVVKYNTGQKRGRYKRSGKEKERVFGAALDGSGDWGAVAAARGVSVGTAYGWIRHWEQPPNTRGGARHKKEQMLKSRSCLAT